MKLALALALVAGVGQKGVLAQSAPRVTSSLTASDLTQLETLRKQVWVDWYAGNTEALRRSLGPELVAITPGSEDWKSLEESIAASAKFKAEGGTLKSVTFGGTTTHRAGDVVVMFSHYIVTTANKGGEEERQHGRATEVFVRHNGQWVHTSWHLDLVP